jgi:hypothetical protein
MKAAASGRTPNGLEIRDRIYETHYYPDYAPNQPFGLVLGA